LIHFLHTADWQIGTRFGQFSAEEGALLTEARFETVERIARLAAEKGVDAVLVAGDVFDQQTVSDRVIRRLFATMAGYTGPWFLISGNHDAAMPESVWSRAGHLNCIPANVQLLLTPQTVSFNAGFSVLAAPLTQRHTYDDVTAFFDTAETPAGHIRIGLSHGSVMGRLPDAIDSANPIAEDRAVRASLDYLALGDWHGVYQVDDRTWYAGTPETDRFRNNRSGMVLEVEIDAPGSIPVVTEHRTTKFNWERWEETLSVPSDLDLLEEKLSRLVNRDVLNISISGTLDMAGSRRLEAAIEQAAAVVRAVRCDMEGLRLAPTAADLDALGAGNGYLANVVASLKAMQEEGTDRQLATEALMILSRIQSDAGRAA
jgi:DNA repair exonuclease SbcCD nuclease subunit